MKNRKLAKVFLVVLCIVISAFVWGCTGEQPNDPLGKEPVGQEGNKNEVIVEDISKLERTEEGIIVPSQAKEVIENTAKEAIKAIRDKDFMALAELAHPEKGVRFTPYTHVSTEQDQVFKPEDLKDFFQDDKVYLWGYYDGSGEEMKLTPAEYYEKFIYSSEFINPEKIGYNEVLSFGNMLENQFEVYEDPIIVEYYFSGFDKKYEGMDWQSLRLVFQHHAGDWKLVGIIHNQWTI